MPLIIWLFSSSCIFDRFCSSANHFSVTFNLFFKKYISFVLSQYKNKAHCTYCSIGKVVFFVFLCLNDYCCCPSVCRWVVSCHYPGFLLFLYYVSDEGLFGLCVTAPSCTDFVPCLTIVDWTRLGQRL